MSNPPPPPPRRSRAMPGQPPEEPLKRPAAGDVRVAPLERVADALGPRRLVSGHDLEELRHADRRVPVEQPDPAPRLGYACELGGDRRVVRREHDPAGRADGVEGRVVERQVLGVAHQVLDVLACVGRHLLGGLDQRRREVKPGDVGPRGRRTERQLAGARRQISPLLALDRRHQLEQVVVPARQLDADPVVGTVPPHHAVLVLQLLERHRPSNLVVQSMG